LHQLGYTHNDLKLENFLVGYKDPNVIYLIDFGLSEEIFKEDGGHVDKKFTNRFSGNLMFSSHGSTRCITKSRRDDVQSILLIMSFLLNDNSLPWSDLLPLDRT
jgi:vaccinia related kinase